jgi:GTP cyclohydrolase II
MSWGSDDPPGCFGPALLPLESGDGTTLFELRLWSSDGERWIVAHHGDVTVGRPVVRIESACAFGHLFASAQCDCGFQWRTALAQVAAHTAGVLLYGVDQDARGLGLETHFEIYRLRQQENYDSDEIYRMLDQPMDARSYAAVPWLLHQLEVSKLTLLSNNRSRIALLGDAGFDVESRGLTAPLTVHNMSTLMIEQEDLDYTWHFQTHGDWLESIQADVAGRPERRRLLVVDEDDQVVHQATDDGQWDIGVIPSFHDAGRCVAYLTDLPRADELASLAAAGVAITVVPLKVIPDWARHVATQVGIRLVDWARRNRYREGRPQWELVAWRSDSTVYRRCDDFREVLADGTWRAVDGAPGPASGPRYSTTLVDLVVSAKPQ